MTPLLEGFGTIFTPDTLFWIVWGVMVGYVVGVIPGLSKGTAVAIVIPLTFYMQPVAAIAFLVGIAKGSSAGSAISAILLNAPGEASSAPTALDGYPLARQGKAQKALKMGLFASVIGDFTATVVLIALAATLARYALRIGPVEIFAILLFALTFIGSLSGRSPVKGLIAGVLGILLASVGLETETAVPRFTFGMLELYDGIALIPMTIGMLALSEMILQLGRRRELDAARVELKHSTRPEDRTISRAEWRACLPSLARGSLIGCVVGILPGLGASVASFLSWGAAQKAAKDPSRFGKGAIEGVAASESADNAVVPASFVPLFAIGVPGSVIAAILISAFMIHGVTPGPMMFIEQPQMVYGIFAAMLVASVALLAVGWLGQNLFARVVNIPVRMVIPFVVFFCCLGAYLQGGGMFGIGLMLAFAVLGVIAKKLDFSFVTFLVGFIIGPSFELTLRQTIALTDGQPLELVHHPIALVFIALTAVTLWRFAVQGRSLTEKRPLGAAQN